MQVCSDLLISNNGIPGFNRKTNQDQFVEFHVGSDDLLYKDTFSIPRFGAGGFIKSLVALLSTESRLVKYSTVQVCVFNQKGNSIKKNNSHLHINNFYMIGDNPAVDILGANQSEFNSILVKYKGS